ncbi:MAG: SufD family Fe-S cluster assembly protein, partial [Anaerolineales bacterium]
MTSRVVIRRQGEARRAAVADFPFGEDDVRAVSRRLDEPAWLLDYRLGAWQVFRDLPMPSLSDEAWRRTDLRGLPSGDVKVRPADEGSIDPEFVQPLVGERHGALLTVRPGRPARAEISVPLPAQGVIFTDWATAVSRPPQGFQAALDRVLRPKEGKFAALAAALAGDGVVVWVPPRTEVAAPLHSVLWAPGARAAFFTRVLVVVGEGSHLTFVHETASPTEAEGQAVHAGLVSLDVGPEAQVTFVELQSWGEHVWNFTHERARLDRQAHLNWIFGAVGSHLTKNFTELDLAGEGSVGRMSGFYFSDGVQHLDHDTQQNHLAPHTTSDLLFKGAL